MVSADHQLIGIKTTLLSKASVEAFKGKIMRALRKPGTDVNRIPKLENEVATMSIPSARAYAPLRCWSGYGRRKRNWSACGSSRR